LFSSTKKETLATLGGGFEIGKNKDAPKQKKRAIPLSGIALSGYLNTFLAPSLMVNTITKFSSNIASVYYCLEKIRRIRRIIIRRSKIPFAVVFG
jgi:hypothetical protein